MSNRGMDDEPWYRNPWVWLVIAIPSMAVAGGLFTLYLAISHPQIIVTDDVPAHAISTGSRNTGTE